MEKIKQLSFKKRLTLALVAVVVAGLVLTGSFYGYLYVSTPAHIRNPAFEHYHFRAQVVVDGKDVDFSADEFQQHYDSASCSIDAGEQPIDFHDHAEQMAHVHWDGITGGEFLKYFGWNFIGGSDDTLGRRYDDGIMRMHNVGIYGDLLPDLPDNANFYVYAGDENDYEQKDWNNFLNQNLEEFFGKKSNLKQREQTGFNPGDWLFPKAYARGDVENEHEDSESKKSQKELTRINNLIGNVVIFVQENEPPDDQIKAQFDNLAPLNDSTCGG